MGFKLYNNYYRTTSDKKLIRYISPIHIHALAKRFSRNSLDRSGKWYFITIPITHSGLLSNVHKVVYSKINQAIFNMPKAPAGNQEMTLFVGSDIEGTRYGSADFGSSLKPHLHCVLFIPPLTADSWNEEKLLDAIVEKLKTISEVDGSHIIHIERMNQSDASIRKTIGYSKKGVELAYEGDVSGYEWSLFPFEFDCKKMCKKRQAEINEIVAKDIIEVISDEVYDLINMQNAETHWLWCAFGLNEIKTTDAEKYRIAIENRIRQRVLTTHAALKL